jgi:isopenicillin N synthase-like dioxygenase
MSGLPVVDLSPWLDGSDRPAVAAAVDAALSSVGFFLVTGHGVDPDLIAATRRAFTEFFTLPAATKSQVRMPRLGMAGWAPMGMEANGYSFGHETPPDMKESYRLGAHELPGREVQRGENVWPAAPAGFREIVTQYLAAVDRLHMELLRVCAAAVGLDDPEFFAAHATRNDNTLNVNWYPPVEVVGEPLPNQFRIGPHTDFGTLTLLHREPGSSSLEVQLADGEWVHAPVVDGSFTINAGDVLAHWSGGRWRSAIHRIPPPVGAAGLDSLLSLVYFCDPDAETMIEPLGGGAVVNAGEYLRAKIAAITMTANDTVTDG